MIRVFRLLSIFYPYCGFCGDFQKKGRLLKDEKYFFMGSEILRITHVT